MTTEPINPHDCHVITKRSKPDKEGKQHAEYFTGMEHKGSLSQYGIQPQFSKSAMMLLTREEAMATISAMRDACRHFAESMHMPVNESLLQSRYTLCKVTITPVPETPIPSSN